MVERTAKCFFEIRKFNICRGRVHGKILNFVLLRAKASVSPRVFIALSVKTAFAVCPTLCSAKKIDTVNLVFLIHECMVETRERQRAERTTKSLPRPMEARNILSMHGVQNPAETSC